MQSRIRQIARKRRLALYKAAKVLRLPRGESLSELIGNAKRSNEAWKHFEAVGWDEV